MKTRFLVSRTTDDIIQILRSKTEVRSPLNYRLWVSESVAKSKKLYYGNVAQNSFRIIPLVPGKNFFTPIISGETEKVDDHMTRVICSIHASPFAYSAIASCVLIGTLSFVSPVAKLVLGELCTLADWFHPASGCILVFVFSVLNYISQKKYLIQFINFIKGGI